MGTSRIPVQTESSEQPTVIEREFSWGQVGTENDLASM